MIWEVKHEIFTPKGEDGMPGEPMHLVVARNVLDTEGGEVLREQRPSGDAGVEVVAGGVLAMASRALFRGPEIGDRAGSV